IHRSLSPGGGGRPRRGESSCRHLVEDHEQLNDSLQECIDLSLIVALWSFFVAKSHVAYIFEAHMFFVIEVTCDAGHANVDLTHVIAWSTGCCRAKFLATWTLKPGGELFEPSDQLEVPCLLSTGNNVVITFGFPQGVFKTFQHLVYLVCAVAASDQVKRFLLDDVGGNARICFVGLP